MSRQVACFNEAELESLAARPNTVVYRPTHDILYDAWSAERVCKTVDRIIAAHRSGTFHAAVQDGEVADFASKYTVLFKKLSDPEFVRDSGHVATVKRLIALRAQVETGEIDETSAQAQSADIALKSLASRVRPA